MDTVMLSRLQFAIATLFHFIFVPISIGLPFLIAVMETHYVRTGNLEYKNHARFWGRILIINFVLGVVTGLTLEFQFGTNWSRYSKYVGDIFGPLLATEVLTGFFLESTFMAVWFFGWNKVSPKIHALAIWLVALAACFSAVWILLANAWMQHPVGYVFRNGRAELDDFSALIFHRFAFHQIIHTINAAFVVSGFFMLGISACQILKNRQMELFAKSFHLASVFTFIFSITLVLHGHLNGEEVANVQPAKLASMEPTWETQNWAPLYLFLIPDAKGEKNLYEFGKIPGMLSILAYRSPHATVKGLKEFPPEDRPPLAWTFFAFRLMIMLGFLFILLSFLAWWKRDTTEKPRWLLWSLVLTIPLPYLAAQAGWIVTEVGRQPWIVYGLSRTKDAASTLAREQILSSLLAFIGIYTLLGIVGFLLIAREVNKGIDLSSQSDH